MNLKTKKIFLLISTIFVLIIDIAYIIMIYTGAINVENVEGTVDISNESQMILLGVCALVNFISIFLILKNPLKNKKKLIFFNVFKLLIGTIFNVISAIINIVLLARKTEGIEEEVKEKKPLPNLEDITKHKWYVYFIVFVFLFTICYTPATNLLPIPNTRLAATISIIALYIIQIALSILPMINELKRDFVVFKDNFKLYMANMLPRFGIIAVVYLCCNLFLTVLVGSIPTNQELITSLPIYFSAFFAIVIAPVTEELMFRGFIKKFIRNDVLFVIVSSLVFGGLHVIVASSLQQVLFIIPYSILGFAFSLNYVKTRNIVSNIFLHSAWNSIAVIAMILLKLL